MNKNNRFQIQFVAPFATDVQLNPAALIYKGTSRVQEEVAEMLENLFPALPFRTQLEDKGTEDSGTSYHPNEPLYPTVFLKAELGEDRLQTLQDQFPGFSKTFAIEEGLIDNYELKIHKAHVSLYHYGFGSINLETTLSGAQDFTRLKSSELNFEIYMRYFVQGEAGRLFRNISGSSKAHLKYDVSVHSNGRINKPEHHHAVSQFKPVIDKLRNCFRRATDQYQLDDYRKEYRARLASLFQYDDFLSVHHIYFFPFKNSGLVHVGEIYGELAGKTAFDAPVEPTKVEGLRCEICDEVHIGSDSSYALVSHQYTSEFSPSHVKTILPDVIQTAGVFNAATIDLARSLDVASDLLSDDLKDGNYSDSFSCSDSLGNIKELSHRASHLSSLISQYERALSPVSHKILDAIKTEWRFEDRWDYIETNLLSGESK